MSETDLVVDVVVVGFGISAVGAALELAAQGRSTIVVRYPNDSVCLASSVVILPTPLAGRRVPGFEFEQIALNALKSAGIAVVEPVLLSATWSDRFEVSVEGFSLDNPTIKTDRILFAPVGTDPIVLTRPDLRVLYGRGLSTDAWSDAPGYKGKHIAIVGCGSRAIEQSSLAAKYASEMTLICEGPRITPSAERWLEIIPAVPSFDSQFGVRFVSALADELGRLRQVIVSDDRGERAMDVSALFFAQELVPDWSFFGDQAQVNTLMARRALIPAGLAAGTPYDDHERLFTDGARAARELK